MNIIEAIQSMQSKLVDKNNLVMMVGVDSFSRVVQHCLDYDKGDEWLLSRKEDGFIVHYKDMQIVRLEILAGNAFMIVQMMALKEIEGGFLLAVGREDEPENTRITH